MRRRDGFGPVYRKISQFGEGMKGERESLSLRPQVGGRVSNDKKASFTPRQTTLPLPLFPEMGHPREGAKFSKRREVSGVYQRTGISQ